MISQNVTVYAIVCPACERERPALKLSPGPAQPRDLSVSRDRAGAWTLRFKVSPGTYDLTVSVPYRSGNPGCLIATRFTVLRGYDRHFAGLLAPPTVIGGEAFNRSVYGTLPFPGMVATIQRLDVRDAPETPVPIDGAMYDAESLGATRYRIRFYFTPGDLEGPKCASIELDLRNTPQLTKLQRDVTVEDLSSP